ncbi:hypothetical protein Q1695_003277 [Nippostrongylus brasiliensis]|nr:hypothetical protein Q1695_003277 [Nippostrongylus brasiliensis]
MARILSGLEDNCLAYLDDIIIFNKDFHSHLHSLRKVFERFRVTKFPPVCTAQPSATYAPSRIFLARRL